MEVLSESISTDIWYIWAGLTENWWQTTPIGCHHFYQSSL